MYLNVSTQVLNSVSKGRDVPGQTGTGHPVVPLSRDKKKILVPGQNDSRPVLTKSFYLLVDPQFDKLNYVRNSKGDKK